MGARYEKRKLVVFLCHLGNLVIGLKTLRFGQRVLLEGSLRSGRLPLLQEVGRSLGQPRVLEHRLDGGAVLGQFGEEFYGVKEGSLLLVNC